MKKPPQTFRERVLARAERQEVMAAIRDQAFRDFVFAMQETGCRPSEVARVTAGHVNLELGVWVFMDHKTVKKNGRGRCLDNVFVERLWRSVKYEDVYLHRYESLPQLWLGLVRYFGYYNEERLHRSLDYRKPAAVYRQGK